MTIPAIELARVLEAAALTETRSIFPGTSASVLWTDCIGDRAIVVVKVDLDNARYLHQVACLREGGAWHSWTTGPAPGWLEMVNPFGVVTRCDRLEPGTSAVRLRHFGVERVVVVDGNWLFQALWDVTVADGEWAWPEPTDVSVDGRWESVALIGVPVRGAFLVDRYVSFERSNQPDDQWAWDTLMEGVCCRPETTWPILLQSIEAAPDDRVLFSIAAGPLEDLISEHAERLVEVIEDAAASSPKLRKALSGVWAELEDAEIAARLARVAGC